MFTDDTNFFHEHKKIKSFAIVNEELKYVNDWFISDKLSPNVDKTKCSYSLFKLPKPNNNMLLQAYNLRIQ